MRRFFPVALIALLLTAGCTGGSDKSEGSDGGSTPSATSTPTGPPCADIWKAGETLPADYASCVEGGVTAEQEVYECTDGTKLVAFADTMYAVTGGEILKPKEQPFQDTEEYGATYSDCTGE